MIDWPLDSVPGNHRLPPLDAAGQSTSRADEQVKRQAAATSPAPWHTCQNTDVEHDGGGTWSPTGLRTPGTGNPQARCGTRPDDQPTS